MSSEVVNTPSVPDAGTATDSDDGVDVWECGALFAIPESYNGTSMYTCTNDDCRRSCRTKADFYEVCDILKASDLEPRECDLEPRECDR